MSGSRLWYVRRGNKQSGPYPAAQIKRSVLLGRLRPEDQLSENAEHWRPLREFPAFYNPENLANEQLRRMADERSADRRAAGRSPGDDAERRDRDRRSPEPATIVEAREQRQEVWNSLKPDRSGNRAVLLATILLIAVIGAASLFIDSMQIADRDAPVDCAAPPAPDVRWNGCDFNRTDLDALDLARAQIAYANLEAANLVYSNLMGARLVGSNARGADLRYTRLVNADLSHADLRDANLAGADLAGARLDGAIWIDGKQCARGSIGACLQ